jgi:hypothetical protein
MSVFSPLDGIFFLNFNFLSFMPYVTKYGEIIFFFFFSILKIYLLIRSPPFSVDYLNVFSYSRGGRSTGVLVECLGSEKAGLL